MNSRYFIRSECYYIDVFHKYFHTTSTFWIFDPESRNCLKYLSHYYRTRLYQAKADDKYKSLAQQQVSCDQKLKACKEITNFCRYFC